MQAPLKWFQLDSDSHTILTTYQPSHIDFRVLDKHTNLIQKGVFYDCTLPANVKDECEAVEDLYQYLESKSSSEMQVEGNTLRFKVVRIKKERWYSLEIEQEVQEIAPNSGIEEIHEKKEEMMQEEVNNSEMKALGQKIEELEYQNEALRREVERLQGVNQQLLKKLQSKDLQLLIENGLMEQVEEAKMEEEPPKVVNRIISSINQQQILPQQLPMAMLTLTETSYQNHDYRLENSIITKTSNRQRMYIFKDLIHKGEKLYFSIKLLNSLHNNWIIFGVNTENHHNSSYSYFKRGCIAYSGSIGIIYNETDTIDLNIKLGKGDQICMQLNFIKTSVEWFINNTLVYTHKMGRQMWEKVLYPFLSLAHAGDSVQLNCNNDVV